MCARGAKRLFGLRARSTTVEHPTQNVTEILLTLQHCKNLIICTLKHVGQTLFIYLSFHLFIFSFTFFLN